MKLLVLLLCVLLGLCPVASWNGVGHMLVAQIALNQVRFYTLLAKNSSPFNRLFVFSSSSALCSLTSQVKIFWIKYDSDLDFGEKCVIFFTSLLCVRSSLQYTQFMNSPIVGDSLVRYSTVESATWPDELKGENFHWYINNFNKILWLSCFRAGLTTSTFTTNRSWFGHANFLISPFPFPQLACIII